MNLNESDDMVIKTKINNNQVSLIVARDNKLRLIDLYAKKMKKEIKWFETTNKDWIQSVFYLFLIIYYFYEIIIYILWR